MILGGVFFFGFGFHGGLFRFGQGFRRLRRVIFIGGGLLCGLCCYCSDVVCVRVCVQGTIGFVVLFVVAVVSVVRAFAVRFLAW